MSKLSRLVVAMRIPAPATVRLAVLMAIVLRARKWLVNRRRGRRRAHESVRVKRVVGVRIWRFVETSSSA